jgi:KUP system potassium uptake protein
LSAVAAGRKSVGRLVLGAIGVVYGDIGTSPLYVMKQTFTGSHPLELAAMHIHGVLSLVFWSITIVVSIKYAGLMMRADNNGEGGSLSLLARISRVLDGRRLTWSAAVLGVFAAALFYGDSMITPAISVFSAVEGLEVIAPDLGVWVEPVTLAILIGLFAIQRFGTGKVGYLLGPITSLWFAVLAFIGVLHIFDEPSVLLALNPYYAIDFFIANKITAFLALGSVVLAVTGAEALFTDMGHFGKAPIRIAWFWLVFPALILNYFGQGALLIGNPAAIENPFYHLVPAWAVPWLVVLATAATVIASQAVISGAFSVTRQAIQLGYLPRMNIVHTSSGEIGQVYIPFVNWLLMVFVVALVIGFDSSDNLAAAYGVAVTGTMLIDTLLISIVIVLIWKWHPILTSVVIGTFLIVDLAFLSSNLTKVPSGGWFPLAVGLLMFVMLTTWKRGRELVLERIGNDTLPVESFIEAVGDVRRVEGTGVFMSSNNHIVPHAMLHNLKHNKVLHERVVLLTLRYAQTPAVPDDERLQIQPLGANFYRMDARFGFMEDPDVPKALELAAARGLKFDTMSTSFFLSRETLIPSSMPGMAKWRERLFSWMSRSATSAMDFFRIPPNRVVELGTQIEI